MTIHSPIGTHFLTHGIDDIETHHRTRQLLDHADTRRLVARLGHAGRPEGLRARLGGMLIALGAAITGTTHDLQERQGGMPSPFRKSGFVPTR